MNINPYNFQKTWLVELFALTKLYTDLVREVYKKTTNVKPSVYHFIPAVQNFCPDVQGFFSSKIVSIKMHVLLCSLLWSYWNI